MLSSERTTRVNLERLVSAFVVATALVLAAAACGGGASAEEKWAGSVCSAVTDWKSTVQQATSDIRTTVQSPQTGMLATIDADVRKAVDATNKFASDLKSLGPPNTEGGTQAKQQLDALAAELQTTAKTAKETVAAVPKSGGATAAVQALAPLAPALQSLSAKTSSTLAAIQAHSKALKEGFDKADACKPYR
jgi:hypothetical protein